MTTPAQGATGLPLLDLMRATRLPPPPRRRAIRERARLSRRVVAAELGVSPTAVFWWEKEDGFDPRPAVAVAYKLLLERIEAETRAWDFAAAERADPCTRSPNSAA